MVYSLKLNRNFTENIDIHDNLKNLNINENLFDLINNNNNFELLGTHLDFTNTILFCSKSDFSTEINNIEKMVVQINNSLKKKKLNSKSKGIKKNSNQKQRRKTFKGIKQNVFDAIESLSKKKDPSLLAIKNYIVQNSVQFAKANEDHLFKYIKRYTTIGCKNGVLKQKPFGSYGLMKPKIKQRNRNVNKKAAPTKNLVNKNKSMTRKRKNQESDPRKEGNLKIKIKKLKTSQD